MADKGIGIVASTSGFTDKMDTKTVTNGIGEEVQRNLVAIAEDLTTPLADPLPVQLSDGTYSAVVKDGSTEAAFVDMAAVVALRPSENHVGEVGGNSGVIHPTLAVSTTAYTAGDNVGGLLTVTGAMRKSGGTGVAQSIVVTDHANQKAAFEILIFKSSPAATFTDNAVAPTLTAADLALIVGKISIAAAAYASLGSQGIASFSIGEVVAASGSANLYAAITTLGTPTYANTTDLGVGIGFLRD